jgi:hypothetical protein
LFAQCPLALLDRLAHNIAHLRKQQRPLVSLRFDAEAEQASLTHLIKRKQHLARVRICSLPQRRREVQRAGWLVHGT